MMTQAEIQSLAHELAKALAPLLQAMESQESTELPDGTNARIALKNCNNFADADRRLERGGIASEGKRRTLIAKLAPTLFNAKMKEAFTG